MRHIALPFLLAACASAPHPPAPARGAPPVVVAIVVDQLAAWIADERLPQLPESGGFARLRREGTWLHELRYVHAITETGPGHAALFTGALPRDSGVFANERLDEDGKKRSLFLDDTVHLLTPDGDGAIGPSARLFSVPTLADRLREAKPRATIISVSLKERSAICGGGRQPTVALWFDRTIDSFATSSAFATTFPAWAVPLGGSAALRARRAAPWRETDPAWVAAHARVPDDGPGEGDLDGFGTVFPHDFAATKSPARAFRSTPLADEVVLDLALAALDADATPGAPVLLALSFSANDYVGHVFGTASHEAWDNLFRLDASLARLFTALDERYGAGGWSALLTADHGISRTQTTRILQSEMTARLEAAADAAIGDGHWVIGISDPYVDLTRAARALPAPRLEALMNALLKTLVATPGVADARDARKTPATCPPFADESLDALLCRSLPPTDEPRIYVVVADGAFFDPDIVIGSGGSHGAPRLEDRTVPLLLRAPGRVAAGRSVAGPRPYTAFTQTLAALLGLGEKLPEL